MEFLQTTLFILQIKQSENGENQPFAVGGNVTTQFEDHFVFVMSGI